MWPDFFMDREPSEPFVRVKRVNSRRHRQRGGHDINERYCRRHADCFHADIHEWNAALRSERRVRKELDALKGAHDAAMDTAERERHESSRLRHELNRVWDEYRETKGKLRECQDRYARLEVAFKEKCAIIEELWNKIAALKRLLKRHKILG